MLKAYTVNNTADLCGGLRFSWSEWISLSTYLSAHTQMKKRKPHICGILKSPEVEGEGVSLGSSHYPAERSAALARNAAA